LAVTINTLHKGKTMTAYVIVDIEVTDPEGYKEYVKLAPEAVKLYGGKYIARGGPNETLEGDWQAKRLVILEFPSMEQAKLWLNSPEYAPARAMRHKYAQSNMVVVEGT
jgi:uncharacterized protein (DUF1330 family)